MRCCADLGLAAAALAFLVRVGCGGGGLQGSQHTDGQSTRLDSKVCGARKGGGVVLTIRRGRDSDGGDKRKDRGKGELHLGSVWCVLLHGVRGVAASPIQAERTESLLSWPDSSTT